MLSDQDALVCAPTPSLSAAPSADATLRLKFVIEETVAAVFAVSPAAFRGPSRGRAPIAFSRQVAMYLARVVFGLRFCEIGRVFGRDRTTVAHACSLVEDRRDDPKFDRLVDLLEGIILRQRQLMAL